MVVNGSKFCKKHYPKSNPNSLGGKKRKSTFSKAEKVGIYTTIVTALVAIVLAIYFSLSGPTKENQDMFGNYLKEIKETQEYDKKNSDTIKYILRDIFPPTEKIYEKSKKIFNDKKNEFESLSNKIARAKKDLIFYDSLNIWEEKANKMINQWEIELKEKQFIYRQMLTGNSQKLQNIFEYGYATYLVSPDGESRLVNYYISPENMVDMDWEKTKWQISKDFLGLSITKLVFNDHHTSFTNTHEGMSRSFRDIGLLYYSVLSTENVQTLFAVLTENESGILVLLGFSKIGESDLPDKRI